jgi:hypothetical protein
VGPAISTTSGPNLRFRTPELSRPYCVVGAAGGTEMKLLTESLEHALAFERLAAQENNPEVKTQFESQAAAYRKLAAERAARYGLPAPMSPLNRYFGLVSTCRA